MTKNKREKGKLDNFEVLRKENDFDLVLKNGQSLVSKDKKLRVKYYLRNNTESNKVKAAISVGSDKGNSVWRNRIKRIIRESIRQEKETLLNIAKQKNAELLLIFSPYTINQNKFNKISFKDFSEAISNILNGLKESVSLQ